MAGNGAKRLLSVFTIAAPVGVTSSTCGPEEYTGASCSNFSVAGSGYGKRSVRALDRSSAHVQRRAYPFFDRKRLRSHGGADDIDQGIDGADFVEADSLDWRIVNLGFGLAQSLEDSDCSFLRGCRRSADLLDNARESPFRPRACLCSWHVSCIVILLLPENFARQIFFAVRVHIDFGRRNSATRHPLNLQPRTDIERRDRVFQKLGDTPASTSAPRNMSPLMPEKQSR